MPSVLGTPQIHNEYFSHNEPHNDAPSVSVWGRTPHADEAQKFLPSSLCAAVFVADAAGVHCPKVVLDLVSENTCSGIDICCQ